MSWRVWPRQRVSGVSAREGSPPGRPQEGLQCAREALALFNEAGDIFGTQPGPRGRPSPPRERLPRSSRGGAVAPRRATRSDATRSDAKRSEAKRSEATSLSRSRGLPSEL